MYISQFITALALLLSQADAWDAPIYPGYSRVWQSTFAGSSAQLPQTDHWNIVTGNLGVNAELQTYARSTRNVQTSGGSTLQLVPWRDSSVPGGWTSGRLESKYVFTPQEGRITLGEAQLRFGSSPTTNKKGIWPAFWLLGDSIRHGTPWPQCGEVDVMETVNGQLIGHGTIHCDVYPGGICNEGTGIANTIGIPNQEWHTWTVQWDRTSSAWQSQSITWYMDGVKFHQVTGSRINNEAVWKSLCQSPMYFILNVAVGGNWVSSYLLAPKRQW
jgi:beta-glucanase (GH16 family)